MVHKYLNEIGVPSDYVVIYGTLNNGEEVPVKGFNDELDNGNVDEPEEVEEDLEEMEGETEEETEVDLEARRQSMLKLYAEQREEHGFDERETWELYFTSAAWVYEHLKFYVERASRVINLAYYKMTVPVLYELPEDEKEYIDYGDLGKIAIVVYKSVDEEHTIEEAINITCSYLEQFLRGEVDNDDALGPYGFKGQRQELLQGAFAIFTKIINYLYW